LLVDRADLMAPSVSFTQLFTICQETALLLSKRFQMNLLRYTDPTYGKVL